MHTIVITGGHHNSALVVAKELMNRGHKVIWIGHRHSSRGDTRDSAEYIEVQAAGIPFHNLEAGRLVLHFSQLILFPTGVFQALKLLKHLRPTAILSFGGYLGGTAAIAGKILGLPIYLHEQTVTAGRANILIGKLAAKVYLTWPQSARYFDKSKIKIVGLPLRESILKAVPKKLFSRKKPTLLVMGGKQGAHVLNQFIFTHIKDLLNHFNIVHQTGTSSLTGDFDTAIALQNTQGSLADCYLPLGYISETQIGQYLYSVDYYLGRSGAHICYELLLVGLPAILVPLLSTPTHEQYKNAQILVNSNQGLILTANQLTFSNFLEKTSELRGLTPRATQLQRNASTILVDDLLDLLK